jgi:hypothetical protein
MTIGDAFAIGAFMMPPCAVLIVLMWFVSKENSEKLRIRADLLKAGIDPDRLDKEAE